ncbi:hypothetical protein PYCCODRAFT_1413390 [Trametes coccinea BRFM310]|uniref:Uncharacterized protein n=1 Tax=Trametes coccinea (strain BRFM310) TaxID=1353009 RepID=A0A1Y2IIU1_TRAC3|nr:hypothetical protein PYCCODRAFT_1413390 [Trametes coccinea BRFM310]
MLSVFNVNKRNKTQKAKKFASKAPLKRIQSPPSPASFASPEIVEINEQGPFGGSFPEARAQASSTERPAAAVTAAVSSPQLQLEFDLSEPLFPPSILPPQGSLTPPRRNVSLPNGGRNVTDASSGRTRGATPEEPTIHEEPLQPNRLQVDTSVQNARSSEDVSESSTVHSSRKPTPSPIKIPNNSTSAKIKVQSSADGGSNTNSSLPPPLPSKNSRPPSPTSALTDDVSSAISGTSMARALVATSFVLSNESRASKYKSGITRQDSATLPRGEHPLNSSPYVRERRASSGEPGSARSSSVPPVPRLPARAELGLSMDSSGSFNKSQRNSVALVLESGESNELVPQLTLKRPKSTGRLRREQTTSMPPISPISEASSPAPSVPETPGAMNQNASNVSNASSRSLATSLAQQRAANLSEANASSSSLGTEASGHHARAATEPAGSVNGAGGDRRPSNATKPKGPLVIDRTGAAMPGTMRSSGAFAVTNGRLAVTRTISESGSTRSGMGGASRPAVLLPIGERPSSVLVPPSPQPSIGAPTPTSTRVGGSNPSAAETPVDSPDLLDSFPVQIARERSAGPPPPLPLGRRSEDSAIPTPLQSSSGESMSSSNRQTFPETPNAFSPLWSGTFNSPPAPSGPRSSMDQTLGRSGSTIRAPGLIDMTRMASRGASGRVSGTIFAKPAVRSSRVPPTPPLTGESTSGSQPESPMAAEAPVPQAIKRLTAIEEQVASRSVSQYSTIPEPPTSGAQFGSEPFAIQQQRTSPPSVKEARRARERSDSLSARSRRGSDAQSNAPSQTQTLKSSNMSAAEQAKAAEASSHRRMRSVTNPDEPLSSPPPSYPTTFDPPPPPTPPPHARTGTADSSEQSFRSSIHSSTIHLQASSSQSSIPQKRSLSPLPSPPPSSLPMPPSPGRSRLDAHASSISVEQPPPPYMETAARGSTPPVPPPLPSPGLPPPPTPPASNTRLLIPDIPAPPSTPLRATYTPDSTPTKRPGPPRMRPPLPHGPRAPSYGSAAARMRAGSVSSMNNGVAGGSGSRMVSMASHSAPRFQPTRVHFRGLTMEAAQWTLTSEQLQHIVSTAIRQSADASAIRILPQETLEDALPAEIERLEARSAELKTNYKLLVRRRNAALAHLARLAEGVEHAEPNTAGRVADELNDLNESLDLTAEELYSVTDQLGQLTRLRDLHQRSALAMALRKLNNSFLKQVGEVQRLRDLVETLEAEREEAWQEAQEVAQEFDDFTDRIMVDPSSSSSKDVTPSRRSSRVLLARKNSQRASKSGLRSSMYRRSHRSSTSSSHRYSGAASPGAWQPLGGSEDIPPVPPIPTRRDLIRFPSGDLPPRSSMADSPSSELRAMVQAQKELCEMLGISLEELKVHQPSRRQSMSALPESKSPASQAPTRRNSDIVTPNRRSFKT